MSPVGQIKRMIVRSLARAKGEPLREDSLTSGIRDVLTPRPLLSDVHEAWRGLEGDGFIVGTADILEPEVRTWTLTDKGRHLATRLGE
jgi:hypothetical protein